MSDSEEDLNATKKYQHATNHSVNQYNRREIFKILSKDGSCPSVCEEVLEKFSRLDKNSVEGFINKQAASAQANVKEEANSVEFNLLDDWVTHFKKKGYNKDCGHELSLALRAIAETEKFPDNSEDGVDFKKLYYWLSDVMMGNGPRDLNTQSQMFLGERFSELMEKLNSPESNKDLDAIRKLIVEKPTIIEISGEVAPSAKDFFTKSINPLELNISTTVLINEAHQ